MFNSSLCLVMFLLFFSQAKGTTKTWKFTNDVLDPLNWEGGKPSTNCKGVIFPEKLDSVASVFELYADEVILPETGELEIRQRGFIQLKENSPCLRIKEMKHRSWLSPDSWKFKEENAAVPDTEKVPCIQDDVVFPADATVALYYPPVPIRVNSIQISGVNVTNEQWQTFLLSDYGSEQFYTFEYETEINIAPMTCGDDHGCLCHYAVDDVLYWVCESLEKREAAPCWDPITLSGHCSSICGGVVLLDPTNNFNLARFKQQIPKDKKVDIYASKVVKNKKDTIQVVFVEKEDYTELSTQAASTFFNTISKDLGKFRLNSAQLEVSGIAIPKTSAWSTAFSIILGTFVAASCIFGFLYVYYIGPLENYHLRSRIPFREISLRNLRPFLFSKFENREEGQMSMAASIVSLEKAFDNPMFGTHRPSTSSAAVEVVVLSETQPSTSEATHENLVFSEMKSNEVEIEDVEDTEE